MLLGRPAITVRQDVEITHDRGPALKIVCGNFAATAPDSPHGERYRASDKKRIERLITARI